MASDNQVETDLTGIVMALRLTDLQALLALAGRNQVGRKQELQERVMELIRSSTGIAICPIILKITDLYLSMHSANTGQLVNPPTLGATAGALAGTHSQSVNPSGSYSTQLMVNQDSGSSSSFAGNVSHQAVIGVDDHSGNLPICPDIKMKELPFYDILAVLLRPTTLINQGQSSKSEAQYSFNLSPSQAVKITNQLAEVQLRFCAFNSSAHDKQDQFPDDLVVKVNGKEVKLLASSSSNEVVLDPPSKPLDITGLVKCCPQSTHRIHVRWNEDSQRSFCMQVNLVKKLTADLLFSRMKQNGIKPVDFTRGWIKEIIAPTEEDLDAPTSIRVSLVCPLGKSRMTWPCRASTCKHLQCFDAKLFLLMNEKKPTFVCPVCNKQLKFGDLFIDGYFMDVINKLSFDDNSEVELFADGSWLLAGPAPKRLKTSTEAVSLIHGLTDMIDFDDEIVILDDDEEKGCSPSAEGGFSSNLPLLEPEVIDLTLFNSHETGIPASESGSM